VPEIFKRAAARRDLIEHYVYLAESGGQDLADRFLVCLEESFADVGAQPEIGAPLKYRTRILGWESNRGKSINDLYN
jgi:toxin ParE1/3/4